MQCGQCSILGSKQLALELKDKKINLILVLSADGTDYLKAKNVKGKSENFIEDDEMFVLAFDRHDICFNIYDIISDVISNMYKPKNIEETLKQFSDSIRELISDKGRRNIRNF